MESRPSQPGHANLFTYSADFTTHALKRTFTALQEQEYLPAAQSRGSIFPQRVKESTNETQDDERECC
jgi:hypothetical protein